LLLDNSGGWIIKTINLGNNLTMIDEGHLGGFIAENDPATFTPLMWRLMCKKYNVQSVIDIGCGMGYSIIEFLKYVPTVAGIDGSEYVLSNSVVKDKIIAHDFSRDKWKDSKIYDLAWSCEFLEHVEEKFQDNYMTIFAQSKRAAITYADVGQAGHHHVNCKSKDYWIDIFKKYGLIYNKEESLLWQEIARSDGRTFNKQYGDNHFSNRGLIFINANFTS